MQKNNLRLNWNKLANLFIKAFVFTAFFQIQTILYKSDFFTGLFNPFAVVFLNLSEIFLIVGLIIHGFAQLFAPQDLSKEDSYVTRKIHFYWLFCLIFLIAILVSVIFAHDRFLAFFYFIKCLELSGFIWLVYKGLFSKEDLINVFTWAIGLQVFIGLIQFFIQRDLGLWFLGESKIGSEVLNVAKLDLAGEKIVRAYGTLPHANIYGGVMFVAMGLIIQRLKKEILSISVVMLFFMGIALLVSFSRSAWLAFLMFLLVILAQQKVKFNWKKVLLFLVSMLFVMVVFNLHTLIVGRLLDFSWGAWEERSLFSRVALAIFNDNWYGVGAQNFVLMMDSYSADSLSPWFYQPVHNVFLLALVELGVFGLTALIAVLFALISIILGSMRRIVKLYRHYWNSYLAIMSGLLIVASFDHYLMTSFQGMFLFAMLSGLILRDAMDRKIAMEKLTE